MKVLSAENVSRRTLTKVVADIISSGFTYHASGMEDTYENVAMIVVDDAIVDQVREILWTYNSGAFVGIRPLNASELDELANM